MSEPTNLPASERAAEKILEDLRGRNLHSMPRSPFATPEFAAIISSEFEELIRLGKALELSVKRSAMSLDRGARALHQIMELEAADEATNRLSSVSFDLQAFSAELRRVGGGK